MVERSLGQQYRYSPHRRLRRQRRPGLQLRVHRGFRRSGDRQLLRGNVRRDLRSGRNTRRRTPEPDANLFANGDFENGIADWLSYSEVSNNTLASITTGTAFFGRCAHQSCRVGRGQSIRQVRRQRQRRQRVSGVPERPHARVVLPSHRLQSAEALTGDNYGHLFIKT